MKQVKILGTGCPKCRRLAENVSAAAAELGIECDIEKVTDIKDIMAAGAMMTPALMIDGEIRVAGKVPDVGKLKRLLA